MKLRLRTSVATFAVLAADDARGACPYFKCIGKCGLCQPPRNPAENSAPDVQGSGANTSQGNPSTDEKSHPLSKGEGR